MDRLARVGALAVLVVLWLAVPARAADTATLDDFIGSYVGKSITGDSTKGLSPRDLSVTITREKSGFVLTWTTMKQRDDGTMARKSYRIAFQPTRRDGIYASAMRSDKFGARIPLNPMQGEPYVWARLHGRTMTVYALHIQDDGTYEMQVYDRTLIDGGLDLTFTRLREGQPYRVVHGILTRQ